MPETPPDPDAEFVALLTEHQQALRLYVASLLPGSPDAADVAQQANSTVWKKRAEFELGTNFKAWLFAVARYEVLSYRKRQARDAHLVFSEELEEIFADEIPDLPDDLDRRHEALQSCLKVLSSTNRQLIHHRYFNRAPLEEFARETGRSPGGLKVTLHRIRASLAACIETKLAAAQTPPR